MKKQHHIVVDTETGEVVGVPRNKWTAVIAIALLIIAAALCALVFMQRDDAAEETANTVQETSAPSEIGDDQGSYDHWRALYDAGAIEDTYEQWVDITEQQGFSVREYAKAKDEWNKMHDAGETDMSFEEWWELLK